MNIKNSKLFESSEFYQRRYNNFSDKVVIPVAILICLALIFSLFASREISLKTTGEVMPIRIITDIQSTSSNHIIRNNLSENMHIKRGDLLIRYNNQSDRAQFKYFQKKISKLQDQQSSLSVLKESIQKNQSYFVGDDEYGHSQELADYFNQRSVIQKNNSKENMDIVKQNSAIKATKDAISEEIEYTQNKKTEYKDLENAIRNSNISLSKDNSLYNLYESYKQRLIQDENHFSTKKQIMSEIREAINQLEEATATHKTQKASAGAYLEVDSSLDNQLGSLQAQHLLSIKKELTTISSRIAEIKSNLVIQEEITKKNTIRAPTTGVIHVVDNFKSKNRIPEGTTIAQIYPNLTVGKNVYVVAYINSENISSIDTNDKLRLTSKKENSDSTVLNCKIIKISTAPERTAKGNFFKVVAKAKINSKNKDTIRYGLQGTASIITGTKTYFNYYKDLLFK